MEIEYLSKEKILIFKITEEIDHHAVEKLRRKADLEIEKHIPHHEMFLLPFTPGKCFELQDGNDIYRVVLDDGKVACKWMHALKMFYNIRHEKKDEN